MFYKTISPSVQKWFMKDSKYLIKVIFQVYNSGQWCVLNQPYASETNIKCWRYNSGLKYICNDLRGTVFPSVLINSQILHMLWRFKFTWINLLKIIKNWNAIIILIFQFFSCVQYLLLVIRCENTAPVSWYVNRCFSPINRIFFMTKRNLKDSMLRILGGGGIFIHNEFVKNKMRRLASTLVGTSNADSFMVKSKWSRLICNTTKWLNIQYFHRCANSLVELLLIWSL